MTYKEACEKIVKNRYGLQSIYEDYPKETKERLKKENEYLWSIIDYNLSLARQAIQSEEEKDVQI